MLELGAYPTPVERLSSLSSAASSLWIKRDDLTHSTYGGNKVRKLAHLLHDAKKRGATRVVTVGGVGSHHVLATGIFGRQAGFRVDAALLPQPQSAHVLETIRATAAQGVGLFPANSYAQAKCLFESWVAGGAYYIPAGGSNRLGTLGIVNAALELAAQVHAGDLPEPDVIVVPLGSGGTAAGLLAGLAQAGLASRVLAIAIAEPLKVFAHRTRALAKTLMDRPTWSKIEPRLEIEQGYLGDGYGHASAAGTHAKQVAAKVGITLDDTYTAKAFAAALARVAQGHERTILYWQTLSSAPMTPLLLGAPEEHELDPAVRALAR